MRTLLQRLDSLAAPADRWAAAMACAGAAIALGYGLQISNGTIHPDAIFYLSVAIGLGLFAVGNPRLKWIEKLGDAPSLVVFAGGLVLGVSIHLTTMPGVYLRATNETMIIHHRWVAALAILAGASLAKTPLLGRLRTVALLACGFGLGLWLLKASPSPFIDVWVWHKEAFAALGRGENPYAMTMPNIYGTTDWFAPGFADAAHVFVGYPYPPVTFAWGGLGHFAMADYRYANLVALIASAGLIAFARPGRLGPAAAATLLLSPRELFVLEQGWTESAALLSLAATVFAACRAPRALPWVFGAMLATKQYFVLCLPLGFLLLPRPLSLKGTWQFAWKAAIVPVVLTLPFFAWNPKAFIDSVILFQARQPFRPDSLSYLAWTIKDGKPGLPQWAGFAVLFPAWAWAWLRAPRTAFGFAASAAVMFALFFAFSKQAFCNYYFLIVGAFLLAAASAAPAPDEGLGKAQNPL